MTESAHGKFYAVAHGFERGVYEDWAETQKQITDFPQPVYKKFDSKEEAEKFVEAAKPTLVQFANCEEETDKWYAVARGRVVGVFANYADATKATEGYNQPMLKKFENYSEAKGYVDHFYEGKGAKKTEAKLMTKEKVEQKEEEVQAITDDQVVHLDEEKMEKMTTNGTTAAKPASPAKAKKEKKEAAGEKKEEAATSADGPRETRSSRHGAKPITYYAVARGNKTGVFTDWNECKAATAGFKGAKFKKFDDEETAKQFASGKTLKEIAASKRRASESDDASPPKRGKKAGST